MTTKIPRDDPRAARMSSDTEVGREELLDFVRPRHRWVLATTRVDGRPQLSLVTGGVTGDGRLAIATYPERAKAKNASRRSAVSVGVMGDAFNDAWVQVDGDAEVVLLPDALDGLVEYYRSISGEHPDWDEYRRAMVDQGKCVVLITPSRWGPVSHGGFPPSLFEDE
jgi:PPOX class probable F420-dependent enzyme